MKIPVGRIPKFITASSPKGLQRSMLDVQRRLAYGVNFFDIQFANKKWIAWYYDNDDITLMNVEERLGKDNSIGNIKGQAG